MTTLADAPAGLPVKGAHYHVLWEEAVYKHERSLLGSVFVLLDWRSILVVPGGRRIAILLLDMLGGQAIRVTVQNRGYWQQLSELDAVEAPSIVTFSKNAFTLTLRIDDRTIPALRSGQER